MTFALRNSAAMAPTKRLYRRIRSALDTILISFQNAFLPIAAKYPFAARLYYFFLCKHFDREQQAYLAGAQNYKKLLNHPSSGFALLRRNTHRLEKGLLMRPRRTVFATDYIAETVDCYKKCANNLGGASPSEELIWARDVLREFFHVTDDVPILNAAAKVFHSAASLPDVQSRYIPYCRREADVPHIGIDDFEKLARYRRSVRWFLDKSVEREKIDRAIEIAAQSPSACNRQPFEFRIYDDRALVQKIARIPMGTAGYVESIPVFIVIVGQQRNYFAERDRHLIYIDGSLAAMSFVFAAEVQGLSTCCINWPDIEDKERQMAEAIGLEPDERPVMCLALGYPDPTGMVAYSQKKSLEQIRFYNEIRLKA